jgi:hypothetical protein
MSPFMGTAYQRLQRWLIASPARLDLDLAMSKIREYRKELQTKSENRTRDHYIRNQL